MLPPGQAVDGTRYSMCKVPDTAARIAKSDGARAGDRLRRRPKRKQSPSAISKIECSISSSFPIFVTFRPTTKRSSSWYGFLPPVSERIAPNPRHSSLSLYRKVRRSQSNHQGDPPTALAPHPLDSCAGTLQRRAHLRRISRSAPTATAHTTTSPPKKEPKTRAKIGKTARTREKARTTRRTTIKRNRQRKGSGRPTARAPAERPNGRVHKSPREASARTAGRGASARSAGAPAYVCMAGRGTSARSAGAPAYVRTAG